MDIVKSIKGQLFPKEDPKKIQKKATQYMEEVGSEVNLLRPTGVMTTFGTDDYRGIDPDIDFFTVENLYQVSDDIKKIVKQIVTETIRTGYTIKPLFVKKCKNCGTISEGNIDVCENCGMSEFITPNVMEKQRLEKLFKKINTAGTGGQNLMRFVRGVLHDINVYNNAYVIADRTYLYNGADIVGAKTNAFDRANVKRTRIIMSNDGRYGYSTNGEDIVMACPHHRNIKVTVPLKDHEQGKKYYCEKCGGQLIQAYVEFKHPSGTNYYYLKDEVLHMVKDYEHEGYGVPILLALMPKISILLNQDWYVLALYSLQAPPKGLLVFNAPQDSVRQAWNEMQQVKSKHPFGLRPFALDDFSGVSDSKPLVEYTKFEIQGEEVHLEKYRNEIRRQLGAHWGVAPIFMADMSTSGGLNNEGLQLTVTNRAVEIEQTTINDMFDWMTNLIGIKDYMVRLNPYKEMDLMAPEKLKELKGRNAGIFKQLGYDVEVIQTPDGNVNYKIKGKLPEQDGNTQFDATQDMERTPDEEEVQAFKELIE